MSVGSGDWYVRARGRVLGPFNWSPLESLRDRGQLSQLHEVSQDRRSWIKATDLPGLYTQTEAGPSRQSTSTSVEWPTFGIADDPASSSAPAVSEAAPSWFLARGETHHGPLRLADLQRMIDSGEMGPNSMLWTNGMENWVPANQVAGLWFGAPAGAIAGSIVGHSPYPNQSAVLPSHQSQRISGLAVAGFVLGLLWLCGLGSLLATIFGAVARSQISRSNGTLTGKGLALAGLILGILGLFLAFVLLCAIVLQAEWARWGP
jgi:GYF domain 2/Domain of unknown function (DUF4190)